MDYIEILQDYVDSGKLPPVILRTLRSFLITYTKAAEANKYDQKKVNALFNQFIQCIIQDLNTPYTFEPFHECIRAPFDYYQFGLDFIRPIVIFETSKILHPENLTKIEKQLAKGENVVLLANHQTELDPQAISVLLENDHPKLAEEMIFVAGQRVISDYLAIPFSKGRNLLCIYSKKYIEDHPETKEEKLLHNQRTMNRMSQLLSEGGKCIYVAPSGGRDRPGKSGEIEVAAFDPQSIEMFWLMSQKAGTPTHFYPLALSTYDLLPPPDTTKKKLGEPRHTKATPIYLAFGDEINMETFPGSAGLDKKQRRQTRAKHILEMVVKDYQTFKSG